MIPAYADVYQDIADRLTSVLVDTTKVYRTQRLNRQNWQNLVNSSQLVAPYLILETGVETPMGVAMDSEAYSLSIAAYYVVDATPNAVEEVTELMQRARTALWQTPLTLCSLHNQPPALDCTEANPANQVFYDLQSKKFAGMLTFDAIVGNGIYFEP